MTRMRRFGVSLFATAAVLLILFAPLLSSVDPLEVNTDDQLAPPGLAHPFGTDLLGRDVLGRFLHGGQRTLATATASVALAACCALILRLAALAASRHGLGDDLLNIATQALLAVPGLALALTATTVVGRGDTAVVVAAGITQIAPLLRTAYAAEQQARLTAYVEAARSLGASPAHIWRWHIAPAMLPVTAAGLGNAFAQTILVTSTLGFLGFGGEISAPEWGRMLYEGRQVLRVAPWVSLAPAFGITILIYFMNHLLRRLAVNPAE
ncbi:MAG: ABC transporter permease [Anaerolineae bacterium]|nr:ABC transporter permease [Anaerolineae bacterium]NUQ02470.1 ABC transporter permease [Anaerolineae bacterium]